MLAGAALHSAPLLVPPYLSPPLPFLRPVFFKRSSILETLPPNSVLRAQFRGLSNPCSSSSDSSLDAEDEDVDDYSGSSLISDDGDEGGSRNDTVYINHVAVEIEKAGRNRRRIHSWVRVEADLHTIWSVLTDYERLADFVPGLVVSRLIEKRDNFARLFQIGQQNFKFGLKFNAEGILDCYEKDIERLPLGQKRDIEFKMIEGGFQIFEGKWSIEQNTGGNGEFHTRLSYFVDVKPKVWLPVRFIEGRLIKEIKLNLSCIRDEAMNSVLSNLQTR